MSELTAVATNKAFAPVGPYSQATIVPAPNPSASSPGPSMIYTSGQIPYTADGNRVTGSIGEQTAACLRNVTAILEAAGTSLDQAVKLTVFLTSMSDFPEMNAEYERWFAGGKEKEKEKENQGDARKPARSCVAVKELPLGVPVEIECVALCPIKK